MPACYIDPNPFLPREDRRLDPLKWLAYAAMFLLSYVVFYMLCQLPSSDISIHAAWAAEGDFRDITSFLHHGAHPMWHALVAVLLLFSIPLPVAAALITALCKTLELMLFHRIFTAYLSRYAHRAVITLLAVICGLVTCLLVPGYNNSVYLGVGSPNTWHSCTQMIAMVWMLLCVPYTAHCYDAFERALPTDGAQANVAWRKTLLLGGMLLCSLTAKPTFMQVFLPAACLFFLVKWIQHPHNSRFFLRVLLCVLPAVLFMIVQYLYYFGIIVPSQGDMVLEFSFAKLKSVLLNTLLIQAFPLYILLSTRKSDKRDTFFWLALLMDVIGVAEFLLLGESGRRASDGNFGWGMMGGALIFWVVALIRYVQLLAHDRAESPRIRPTHITATLLLCWHLISGVYYLIYLLINRAPL
ncbi:MAG: hypothetical protein RR367_08920 [Clostridia bacterium]